MTGGVGRAVVGEYEEWLCSRASSWAADTGDAEVGRVVAGSGAPHETVDALVELAAGRPAVRAVRRLDSDPVLRVGLTPVRAGALHRSSPPGTMMALEWVLAASGWDEMIDRAVESVEEVVHEVSLARLRRADGDDAGRLASVVQAALRYRVRGGLSPAEAMAVAVEEHRLVDETSRWFGVGRGVDELLERSEMLLRRASELGSATLVTVALRVWQEVPGSAVTDSGRERWHLLGQTLHVLDAEAPRVQWRAGSPDFGSGCWLL